MKWKRITLILVLMNLWQRPTLADVKNDVRPDLVLKAGQPAPHLGVLVPEPTYRFYQDSVDKSELLQQKLDEVAEIQAYQEGSELSPAWYILGGLVLGLAAASQL